MKSNGLLKWLTIPAVLGAVWLGVKLLSEPSDTHTGKSAPSVLTPEESKRLGADADTARDTVATLVAQVKALRGELKAAVEDNTTQKAENDRLRQRESSLDQRIQSALSAERAQWRAEHDRQGRQTETLLEELKSRVDSMDNPPARREELPVGLGLGDKDGATDADVLWIEPQDTLPGGVRKDAAKTVAPPKHFGESEHLADDTSDAPANESRRVARSQTSTTAIYTAPENATLLRSVAMTALIGRIPIEGAVSDPYPFKVLVGTDNLTANGYELPEIVGAVMSGTASGDWTLSCVRGQIHSVTFVFADGAIRTISSNAKRGGGNRTTEGGLGWISDPFGIPCVSGEQVSNAKQYLTTQMLITAAGAGAAAAIESDNARLGVVNAQNGASLGTVGITGNEALQRILAGGVQEISRWAERLYGQAHAAIVVPPQAQVAVHLNEPLEIDLEHGARKVHHESGDPHASPLD
jgi:integrating conjugative element protein (TIGR03752 family)